MAERWSQLLTSGYIKGGFQARDKKTILFHVEDDRNLEEVRSNFPRNIKTVFLCMGFDYRDCDVCGVSLLFGMENKSIHAYHMAWHEILF